ncbi:MAG: Hsp70 family protein [Actinomycetia bacterium]|nr:Hsp70 family protein [Actinomycetes bacterium]
MSEPLGLSIGMTNLVAARVGRPPVLRRSILTLFTGRAPEVGVSAQETSESSGNLDRGMPGVVLNGFVERVGSSAPLVAPDGSIHRGEQVLAAALEAMAHLVDGGSPIAVATPAHWGPGAIGALRGAMRALPGLAPSGTPAALIPDSMAALAALQAGPGLPDRGVVVLVDLGGSGSSITLADAAANLDPIGHTARYAEFSGDALDQVMLNHVLAALAEAHQDDTARTAAHDSLARLGEECRIAKERLSAETAAVVPAELPGLKSDIRVTRPEFEQLISEPVGGLLNAVEDILRSSGVSVTNVSAVATVGGSAAIPLVTRRLAERLHAPVITTPYPQLNAAVGAALVADASPGADAPTGSAHPVDAPTAMGSAAWAARAAGLAAGESAVDGAASATFRALAWSQDDESVGDPLPYTGDDYTSTSSYPGQGATAVPPPVDFTSGDGGYPNESAGNYESAGTAPYGEPDPFPWYKRPPVLFGVAAAAALLAIGGLALTLNSSIGDPTTVTETATPAPGELPPPVTTVTVGPDGVATTTVSQPPPTPPESTTTSATTTSATTTTTTQPTTTTTTATTTQTTTQPTTTQPTTTQPTTSRQTTTQPTTTRPPTTTTAAPPTTTAAPADLITTTAIAPNAVA